MDFLLSVQLHFTINQLDLNQNFCLVITIRDPEKKANIYDEVTQQLNINNFWNSNIEISTDINISI